MITPKPAAESTSLQSTAAKSKPAAVIYQRYQNDAFFFETAYDDKGNVVTVCWYGNKGILEFCTSL